MAMKPIETRYKGYRFRSRLEARWAIYLDIIGWEWEYEPEGFEFEDGTRYLPDFLIKGPCKDFWLEIKGWELDQTSLNKLHNLARASGMPVLYAIGNPNAIDMSYNGLTAFQWNGEDGIIETQESIDTYCLNKWGRPGVYMYGKPEERDIQACLAARSARFEFGESGADKRYLEASL